MEVSISTETFDNAWKVSWMIMKVFFDSFLVGFSCMPNRGEETDGLNLDFVYHGRHYLEPPMQRKGRLSFTR